MKQTHSHPLIEAQQPSEPCRTTLTEHAGAFLRISERGMTHAELCQHIHDIGMLRQRAAARFQAHGLPQDREESFLWLDCELQLHAELERQLDDGLDFFQSKFAQAMGRPSWNKVRNAEGRVA